MSDEVTQPMPTLDKGAAPAGPDPQSAPAQTAEYQIRQTGRPDRGGGRFWSVRRVPALITGLLLLAATALLLYDLAVVRAGERGGGWRRALADELAERRLGDAAVVVGAVAAVLLGAWLLWLALTPGLRGLLTMRGEPGTRAGIERHAAALMLRDHVMRVPGVRSVQMSVGRRRVRARAVSHFRELETVRTDVDAALSDGVRRLGLAKEPRRSLRVRRPEKQ